MTDRYHSLTVVLEHDTRSDDAEPLMKAITQLRGVLSVTGIVTDIAAHMAQNRAQHELREKLYEILYPKLKTQV